MKNIYNIFYAGLLLFCMLSSTACSEDEVPYDFPGDPYNRVYLLDTSGSYRIVQTPVIAVSNVDFKATLKCTREASANIKATVEVDNSLIEAYNEEHETEYEPIPEAAIVIQNATMNIPEGAMLAADTVRITLTEDQSILSTLKSENGYLIPLRLTTVEGGDAQLSTNIFSTYLAVTVTITDENINHEAGESDITGILVTDQSGWSATTNGSVSSNPITSMFDGDMLTYCSMSNSSEDLTLDINMGKSYTFDAITLYYGQSSWWGDPYEYSSLSSGMTLYTSNDGTSWQSVGEISSNSKVCVFYAPVTTQYIRLVKPKGNSYNVSLSAGVFNVYAK